jgi:hypothetical protein
MAEVTAIQILMKQPAEVRKYSMDFSNLMAADETISGITSVTSARRGGDGDNDLVITDENIVDQTVEMWIAGGTDRQAYIIEVIITTSAGQTLEGDGTLQIKDR